MPTTQIYFNSHHISFTYLLMYLLTIKYRIVPQHLHRRLQKRVNAMYIDDIKNIVSTSTATTITNSADAVIACLNSPDVISLDDDACLKANSTTAAPTTDDKKGKAAIRPSTIAPSTPTSRHFVDIDDQVKPRRTKRSGRQGIRRVRRQNNRWCLY